MKISLIICAYNEEKYIGRCLKSVLNHAPDNLLEVLVVNNASTDKTAEIAARYPGVRVIDESSKGLTKARQRGLMEAKGDLLAFVDADSQMPQNWFSIVNKEFTKDPNLAFLSGPYIYYDTPAWQKWMVHWLYSRSLRRVIYLFN